MSEIKALWKKPLHGDVMKPVESLNLVTDDGIEGNADQGGWRQVTVISEERWAKAQAALGAEVDPIVRRANVMVSGLDLADSRGKILTLGDCQVEIRGETRPCNLMDEQHHGLRQALDADWGGGAFGVILNSGTIHVGDGATWAEQPA